MHSRCTGCIVKPSHLATHDHQCLLQLPSVGRIVEPSRRAARVRERDEDSIAVASTSSDDVPERNASPEALDRERADEKYDARSHQCELSLDPWRAQRDLRWRGTAISRPARSLSWKALGDRRAIREMGLIDAGLGEPAPQLRAGSSREWKPRRELHRTGRLADDHHAIDRLARDDRKRGRQVARGDALRARADTRVKTRERAFAVSNH